MQLSDDKRREIIVYEAFLRRAAQLELPFLLKGSYVTRQYFDDPADRLPGDMDWLCLEHLPDAAAAQQTLNDWATRVTELDLGDGVRFRSFRENAFWRMIDYAMADDFPTVNTDLGYWLGDGELQELPLDVSFNLPLSVPSVPLRYQPLQGAPFVVPYSAPLALQVAWKIHQTLVRPRFKDLFDLLHLLGHATYTAAVRQQTLQALLAECRADGTDPGRLHWLVEGRLERLFADPSAEAAWNYWRHGLRGPRQYWYVETAPTIINVSTLPETLPDFAAQVRAAFEAAGFGAELAAVPRPSWLPAAVATQTATLRYHAGNTLDKAAARHWSLLDRIWQWFK
ncbi:hypothetical protein EJV47_21340 [Hymenobacter gummosus]|uniref:Nucleotidyl transferase AbiEii/AbiGii toxin family protein n=1 Tax=Hymenobacter gummosus TaxID=1776032 RepID=A0A431TY16_9BACT|nr:nucleotidyl transferase AbiEii/AbiGii toxin family protein [Hymenobacter gummosus]RTQ46501.1 hypothetical protein EJV47_21340 [Hymenobacter gummosus]